MPRISHEPTLSRQWELLKLMPAHRPGMTARKFCELLAAAGHSVTKRTVERDLDLLSGPFPYVCNDKSKPYGWHWLPGSHFDIPSIGLAEAVSLGLLEDLLRQLIPRTFIKALEGRFSAAQKKLKALPQNAYATWTDLVRYIPPGMPFLPPSINADVLSAVQDALLHRHQLKVSYSVSGTAAPKELVLHPLALIQQGERSYLLATTFKYENLVLYAIHRIQTAVVLDDHAKRPKGFSLDAYLAQGGAQFGSGADLTIKAHLVDHLAAILRETPISKDQKITTRAGKNTLTATVKDSWQLHFWILSQGPYITVMQPASLRKKIVGQLQETLANYQR